MQIHVFFMFNLFFLFLFIYLFFFVCNRKTKVFILLFFAGAVLCLFSGSVYFRIKECVSEFCITFNGIKVTAGRYMQDRTA